ncbi:MAG: hypothetical protein OCC45_16180 [Desulfotalea sp.]
MTTLTFVEKVAHLIEDVRCLEDMVGKETIEQTAIRLEGLHYAPPVTTPVKTFLRLTSNSLLAEIDKILDMPDQEACALAPDNPKECQDLRLQFISVQIYYYKQLMQLRQENPEAWDEVDEMYVHE